MTVLLVILTFFAMCAVGSFLEYKRRSARKKVASENIIGTPVFAQDGGKPIEDDSNEENKNEERR